MSATPLIPEEKRWTVGGREFVQRPFGLDRLMALSGIVGSLLEWGAGNDRFVSAFNDLQETAKIEDEKERERAVLPLAASLIGQLMKVAPEKVVDVAVLCLDAHGSESDRAHFTAHATPSQLVKILLEMFRQNDMKAIAKDFLEMGTQVSALFRSTK